jgi:hypothetical protein
MTSHPKGTIISASTMMADGRGRDGCWLFTSIAYS